jgi:hypothetical protein
LIQTRLKYFEKTSEVLVDMGFFQCPFDKSLFCKWFASTRIGILWQHVDDRLAGFSHHEARPGVDSQAAGRQAWF